MTSLQDADRAFALQHVPGRHRDAIAALWALDEQLGQIVASTTEPMIGQMRLLWWREALISGVSGHPLLDEVTSLSAYGVGREELATLVDGWEVLLDPLPLDPEQLQGYAAARGTQLFALTSRILGHDGQGDAGAGWALADFACRCSDRVTSLRAFELAVTAFADVQPSSFPRPLRVLVRLARSDTSAGRRTARTAWTLLRSVA